MARASQKWLKSDDPEQWAEAMMLCQSGAPWECSERGKCERGCFTSDRKAASVAWRMIQRLSSDDDMVQRKLDAAVSYLRTS